MRLYEFRDLVDGQTVTVCQGDVYDLAYTLAVELDLDTDLEYVRAALSGLEYGLGYGEPVDDALAALDLSMTVSDAA